MLTNKEYIDSGILEQYVLGIASTAESDEVEMMAANNPDIQAELEAIAQSLKIYGKAGAVEPNPVIKPFLMATIDYTERLKNGEPVSDPPILTENSLVADYAAWLNRPDMASPGTEDIFAKIIGYTPAAITAIVWLKEYAPQEVHDNEYERFLIVEGTCNIIVGDKVHQFVPGDYFAIPLYENHSVKVTSSIPCKIILQRVAA